MNLSTTPITLRNNDCGACFNPVFPENTQSTISRGNRYIHSCGRVWHVICPGTPLHQAINIIGCRCACGAVIDEHTVPLIMRVYAHGANNAPETVRRVLSFATVVLFIYNMYNHNATSLSLSFSVGYGSQVALIPHVQWKPLLSVLVETGIMAGSFFHFAFTVLARAAAYDDNKLAALFPAPTNSWIETVIIGIAGTMGGWAAMRGAGMLGERIGMLEPVRALCGYGHALKFQGSHFWNQCRNRLA